MSADAAGSARVSVSSLSVGFDATSGSNVILDDVSLDVRAGEIVGLVGESGSGKSLLALTLLGLLPAKARVLSGEVTVMGREILRLAPAEREDLRGAVVSIVFQEPMTALNPTLKIGAQIIDVIRRHTRLDRRAAVERAKQLLGDMRIRDVERVMSAYPVELSGGMRQRALIAMAFSCEPAVLVADEPTTALDVTVQAQIMELLYERARTTGTSILLISHDLGLVRHVCDRLFVLHAGQIAECGPVDAVLAHPAHPYTRALLSLLPERNSPRLPLATLPGGTSFTHGAADGCRFRFRCSHATPQCEHRPALQPFVTTTTSVACWWTQQQARSPVR
jgi:peptide/nickel transport system ATP-binding protein